MEIELNNQAKKWQKIARDYADNYLQPHEIEAELNNGELSKEITSRNKKKAIELGFYLIVVHVIQERNVLNLSAWSPSIKHYT